MPTHFPSQTVLIPDTTAYSLLHRLAGYRGLESPPPPKVKIYLATVVVIYLPLLLAALLGPRTPADHLQFFHDWAASFVLLVSGPVLVILMVMDDYVLATSLKQVQQSGAVQILDARRVQQFPIVGPWHLTFGKLNLVAQIGGLVVGLFVAWRTIQIYTPPEVGFWITGNSGLLPIAYVYQYSLTLLYAVIVVFVLRSIVLSLYLLHLMSEAKIRILPFDPDKCGGLQPVSRLGLRNQYTLSILGVNVVLLLMTSRDLHWNRSLYDLIWAASFAYLILGPIVFVGPLLPFRAGMRRAKEEWISEIQQSFRVEFERLREKIRIVQTTEEDEKLIERLRKIGSVVGELPVWPFDATTLRKFLTAYIVPVAVSLLGKLVPVGLESFRRLLDR